MHHGESDPIVPLAAGQASCDAINAAGSRCTFVRWPGDHSIGFTGPRAIQDRTADWVFEEVLLPLGYTAETVG
jgi:predicted esterase